MYRGSVLCLLFVTAISRSWASGLGQKTGPPDWPIYNDGEPTYQDRGPERDRHIKEGNLYGTGSNPRFDYLSPKAKAALWETAKRERKGEYGSISCQR